MPLQGVDAEVLNEDPRQWQTEEKFDRIICKPRLFSEKITLKSLDTKEDN